MKRDALPGRNEAQVHATIRVETSSLPLSLAHPLSSPRHHRQKLHSHLRPSNVDFVKLSIVTAVERPDSFCPVRLVMLGSCFVDSSHCHRLGRPRNWRSRGATRRVQSRGYRGRANSCRHIAYSLVLLSDAHPRLQTRRPLATARPLP